MASIIPQFNDYAQDVSVGADSNADEIFGAAHALGTSLTSQALLMANLTSDSWPNVTLPDFGKRFEDANNLTGVAFLMYTPLITDEKLNEWSAYAQEKQGWLAQDWSHVDPSFDPGPITPMVYYFGPDGEVTNDTSYSQHYPFWQIGPLPISGAIINLDTYPMDTFMGVLNDGVIARRALLSGVVNLTQLMSFLASDNHGEEPHSVIFEPVFSDFTDQASVAGFVQAGFPWQYTFTDILPTGKSHRCNCIDSILASLNITLLRAGQVLMGLSYKLLQRVASHFHTSFMVARQYMLATSLLVAPTIIHERFHLETSGVPKVARAVIAHIH